MLILAVLFGGALHLQRIAESESRLLTLLDGLAKLLVHKGAF